MKRQESGVELVSEANPVLVVVYSVFDDFL